MKKKAIKILAAILICWVAFVTVEGLRLIGSGSSGQKSDYMRVEFSELDSSISSSKLPKDFPAMSILCAGPGTDSSSEGFCVRLGLGKSLPT